jgi:hypothetical protein
VTSASRYGLECTRASARSWTARSPGLQSRSERALPPKRGSGDVLVSQPVKDLVAGSGIGFDDRSTHELKGIPGEWHLYSVAPEDSARAPEAIRELVPKRATRPLLTVAGTPRIRPCSPCL